MKLKLKDLQQEYGEIYDRQVSLVTEFPKDMPADKKTEYNALEARSVEIEDLIEKAKNLEKREAILNGFSESQEIMKHGSESEQREVKHLNALKKYIRNERTTEEERSLLFVDRATDPQSGANPGTGTTGGILIPTTLMSKIEMIMTSFGGILPLASVISTASGNPLDYPVNDDSANEGAIVGESADVTGGTTVVFSKVTYGAFKYTSKTILIPFELIEDSQFDILAVISQLIAERVSRIYNKHLTIGTGSGQPQGVTVGGTAFSSGVGAAAITPDNLVDLVTSLDPAYANSNCRFMFNNSTLGAIRKLKDSQNRPLWNMGDIANGNPNTILGFPYVINQQMASIGASAKSIVFGDFSNYKVRKVGQPRLKRLNESHAEADQVGLIYFDRMDAKVLVPKALRVLTHAAS